MSQPPLEDERKGNEYDKLWLNTWQKKGVYFSRSRCSCLLWLALCVCQRRGGDCVNTSAGRVDGSISVLARLGRRRRQRLHLIIIINDTKREGENLVCFKSLVIAHHRQLGEKRHCAPLKIITHSLREARA